MCAVIPLVAALLGAAPVVADHVDLSFYGDTGKLAMDGDDALVIDGASPTFLRWSDGTWEPAPGNLHGLPSLSGFGFGALGGGRAILGATANDGLYAVERRDGKWSVDGALELPKGSKRPHGVAISPDGNRAVVLHDLHVAAFERGPAGCWVATPFPATDDARGVALGNGTAVITTTASALVYEVRQGKWSAGGALSLQPEEPLLGDGNHLIPTAAAVTGDTIALSLVPKSWSHRAVYVYTRTRDGFARTAAFRSPRTDLAPEPFFGESISLDGDRLLVGAPSSPSARRCGDAYLYSRKGAEWSVEHIEDPSGCHVHAFGAAVALRGSRALVFAPQDGRIYMNGKNWDPRPRRLYSYSFAPVPAPRFAALGVRHETSGDWVGSLEGRRRIFGRLEEVRIRVYLRIARGLGGVAVLECPDDECSPPSEIGRLESPSDHVVIRSQHMAEDLLGRPNCHGLASGTLLREGETLVADLQVAVPPAVQPASGPAMPCEGGTARLVLRPKEGAVEKVGVISSVVVERAPLSSYAGDWMGVLTKESGPVPVRVKLEMKGGALSGLVCLNQATACPRVLKVTEHDTDLSLRLAPFGRNGRASDLILQLSVGGVAAQGLTVQTGDGYGWLKPTGQDSVTDFFNGIRARGVEQQRERAASACVCSCSCGAAQPPGACPWSQCGCSPCPPGIP